MVTSINLGNTFQSGGKTVFGGSASGLDTDSIVTQLVDAKKISVTQVETQVDLNSQKVAAYAELKPTRPATPTPRAMRRSRRKRAAWR